MAVSKEILKIHLNHLHRDLTYTWDKNASRKVDLEMSEQTIHEGKKYLCKECDHQTAQRVISHNTSKLYMKETRTHAGNATSRQLQKVA